MYFGMAMPKSWSTSKKKRMVNTPHTTKPDGDNLLKYYLDVLNGIAYGDDCGVSDFNGRKRYAETPFVHIEISPDTFTFPPIGLC